MAKIKEPILDIMTRLSAMAVTGGDGQATTLYSRIWNNQLNEEKNYDFPKPAAFIEVVNNATWEIMGRGYREADLGFRIHLIHEFYNQDGTFEQDLGIFDLRDSVISLLHLFCPTGCGPLTAIREEQDYVHDNVYHYIIEFACSFIDDAGNVVKNIIYSDPPTDLQINGSFS